MEGVRTRWAVLIAGLGVMLTGLTAALLALALVSFGIMGGFALAGWSPKPLAIYAYVGIAGAGFVVAAGPRVLRFIAARIRGASKACQTCQQEISEKIERQKQKQKQKPKQGAGEGEGEGEGEEQKKRGKGDQRVNDPKKTDARATKTLGFFHPYCNAGGGGERVLWSAINSVCERYPHYHCVVYTGDTDASPEQIAAKAKARFGVTVDLQRVTFAYLHTRPFVEAGWYPHFTMLMQSLASLILGAEALLLHEPSVFIDTMGYAFVLPLFAAVAKCHVAAYVHYPTISTDMLDKVQSRKADFNNDDRVSRSAALSTVKLWYYRLFSFLYGLAGNTASVVMANSTWTCNHILALWWLVQDSTQIVYPPCDVSQLTTLPLEGRERVVVSVAQFRPEKNHAKQLKALRLYLDKYGDDAGASSQTPV